MEIILPKNSFHSLRKYVPYISMAALPILVITHMIGVIKNVNIKKLQFLSVC